MRPLSDTDPMFLVPASVDDIAEAFSESSVPGIAYAITRTEGEDDLVVRDGGIIVAEIYLTVMGGCVVRTAPIMGDAAEMASHLTDECEADALVAAEEAACCAEDLIRQLGGVEAYVKGGKWIPIMPNDRPAWSARVVAENTRRMKALAVASHLSRQARKSAQRKAA